MPTAYGPDTEKVGILNAPTTTNRHGKADLLAPARRVRAMLALFIRHAITACGLVEVGTITRLVLRAHPRYMYLPGAPNTVTRRNRKGSGLVLTRARHKVLHRKGLRIPYPKGFRRRLVQPRVLTENRVTKRKTMWQVGHAPRKRTEPAANLRVLQANADSCAAGIAAGFNVVCLMDTNNLPDADRIMAEAGMRRVASVDVMAMYVSPAPGVTRIANGVHAADRITDHGGLVWALLEFLGPFPGRPVPPSKIPG